MTDNEYMCPNCVTPWKCNGPHILEGDQTDRASAEGLRAALTSREFLRASRPTPRDGLFEHHDGTWHSIPDYQWQADILLPALRDHSDSGDILAREALEVVGRWLDDYYGPIEYGGMTQLDHGHEEYEARMEVATVVRAALARASTPRTESPDHD